MVYVTKWAGSANEIPSTVANTHSLRAGGAAALFASGIDWVTIQRWGSRRSFISHEYVWRDSEARPHLGEKIATTQGLNRFLADVAPLRTRSPIGELPDFHTGSSVAITGLAAAYSLNT